MKLDLNPEFFIVSMDLWRKATDVEIPLAPGILSHFLLRRGELLQGFIKTANNWNMLLRQCDATGDDKVQLEALKAEIAEFKNWAEIGLKVLTKLRDDDSN